MKTPEYYERELEQLRIKNAELEEHNEWLCKQVNEWRDAHDKAVDRAIAKKQKIDMKRKITGLLLVIFATTFARFETHYFGENWMPQSPQELACDVLALAICFIGIHKIITD